MLTKNIKRIVAVLSVISWTAVLALIVLTAYRTYTGEYGLALYNLFFALVSLFFLTRPVGAKQ